MSGVARKRALAPSILALAALLGAAACAPGWQGEVRDFRQDMRNLVASISAYARAESPGFVVIPQNGHELITADGEPDGTLELEYLAAIDGVGREDLFYGWAADDVETPAAERDLMLAFMDVALANGVRPLVTDYCWTPSTVDDSYALNEARGYLSFAAPRRELDVVPEYPSEPPSAGAADVASLAEANSFLYLLNPDATAWPTKAAYLDALGATRYDILIVDLFFEDAEGAIIALSSDDLASIRTKPGGGRRLLVCYLSIGEAEDYRYYWDSSWDASPPAWLAEENPLWPGNHKVEYWDPAWQAILYGSEDSYLDRIIAAGFDGVYLDIIDAYEYFEEATSAR